MTGRPRAPYRQPGEMTVRLNAAPAATAVAETALSRTDSECADGCGGWTMGHNTDDLKGRIDKAAGDLTRGKRLKNEDKTDRAAVLAVLGDEALDLRRDLVPQTQRKHPEYRGTPTELITVLAIEGRRVAPRLRRRVVRLASARVAVTLALPEHDRAFCPESVAVPEHPTTQDKWRSGS
jgi:hypothetical protein